MLHDLLKIKKIREDKAREEVKKCRYRVEVAAKELQQKEQNLEDHIAWRKAEESRLYDEIMDTKVKERELDLLKQRVVLMREKDVVLQEKIQEASKKLESEKEALTQAEKALVTAVQTVEKFEEFTKVLDEEAAREAARAEELELEEFSPRNRH